MLNYNLNHEKNDSFLAFEDNVYANVFQEEKRVEQIKGKKVAEFVEKLAKILPSIGSDQDKIIQIEVLVALSVEGILTVDNLEEKAPMIKSICEMIKFEKKKTETALGVAKRILQ